MTNHIEELMKAAGVVPVHLTDCIFINIRKGYDVGTDCCPGVEDERLKCEDCEHSKETQLIYPAFTPAKQLELIKLIAIGNGINYHFDLHKCKLFDKWEFTSYVNTGGTRIDHTDFEQGLTELVLKMILAGHIDKSEVRRILEDG